MRACVCQYVGVYVCVECCRQRSCEFVYVRLYSGGVVSTARQSAAAMTGRRSLAGGDGGKPRNGWPRLVDAWERLPPERAARTTSPSRASRRNVLSPSSRSLSPSICPYRNFGFRPDGGCDKWTTERSIAWDTAPICVQVCGGDNNNSYKIWFCKIKKKKRNYKNWWKNSEWKKKRVDRTMGRHDILRVVPPAALSRIPWCRRRSNTVPFSWLRVC